MFGKKARKTGLIILLIIITAGAILGLLQGIVYLTLGGNTGFIALIIVSVVVIIGSILGIFLVVRGKKIPATKKEKRPAKNIIIWVIIAILSLGGALVTYFFGFRRGLHVITSIIIIALLGVLFFASIFVSIFGWKQKSKDQTEKFLVKNTESTIEGDTDDQ